MALTWTDIPSNKPFIITSSLIKELIDNMDSLAKYMDTKKRDTSIYDSMSYHNKPFSKKDIIKYRDSLFESAENLENSKVCVAVCESQYTPRYTSCYSDHGAYRTSYYTSKYGKYTK